MKLSGTIIAKGFEMPKTLLNGVGGMSVEPAEVDAASMVHVLQDHINKNLQEKNITIKEERFSCDFDHMYTSTNVHDNGEVRHIKEMSLLHLDVIQHQSEELVRKDKIIAALKKENEMLQQRVERMDRRVSLNHKTKTTETVSTPGTSSDSASPALVASPATHSTSSPLKQATPPEKPFPKEEDSPQPPEGSRIIGGKNNLGQQHHQQQQHHQKTASAMQERPTRSCRNTPSTATDGSPTKRPASSSETATKPAESSEVTAKRTKIVLPRRKTIESTDGNASKARSHGAPVATKKRLYVPGTPDMSLWDIIIHPEKPVKEEKVANSNPPPEKIISLAELEVPSWRIKQYTSCYSMEGTENLDDEVFLKRHQRLETDEKRRKRWDIQRLREQRQYEKLKQKQVSQLQIAPSSGSRRAKQASKEAPPVQEPEALWPSIENIQFIEVTKYLPLVAFGSPVPHITASDFELPWSFREPEIKEDDEKPRRRKSAFASSSCASTTPSPQPANTRQRAAASPSTSAVNLRSSRRSATAVLAPEPRRTSRRR